VLLTDANGVVEFQTIYPGWYGRRAIHIHMKVHLGGTEDDGTYVGGTTAHTGQLAFADDMTEQVVAVEPYASRPSSWARFGEDGVFRGIEDDDPAFFVRLALVDENDVSQGVTAAITVGIDAEGG
jgi:protocatechuate 3,4-dioxygenase beta subunit